MDKVISINNITYKVDNHLTILNGINLNIREQESFALIGKNGAGKTTLFEIILKDLKPTKGSVLFYGSDKPNLKKIGVVYDFPPLFPLLKVREIIDYFCTIYHIKATEIPSEYYTVFGLNSILNSYIKNLSQGERKKLGIFLSIIHNPSILILDEPFANIDPTAIDGIWRLLKKDKRTILFTSHNWKQVQEVATKVAFINKGQIITPPASIKEILNALPQTKKIITEFNELLIKKIKPFDFYINENLIHIFFNESSNLIEIISEHTNNFSFKECDLKDAYLFKIKDYE